MTRQALIRWLSVLCALLAPLTAWPLGVLGILAAVAARGALLALGLGLFLDLMYGAPPVRFHSFLYPFTFLAVLALAIRIVAERYVIGKKEPRL